MGIFDSMFSAFGGTPAQQQPVQQQQPPGNIPPNSGTVDPDNSTVPAGTVIQSQQQPETSPLDAFADLWKPVEGQTPEQLFPNIDPAKLMEAAKKTDFAKVITNEHQVS